VRRLPPWALASAGGVAVLALIASVLLVVQTVSAACASAAPALAGPSSGKATFYTIGANGGNCSFGPQPDALYVALSPTEYRAAGACGGYFDVTGPKGTVRVKVVDQCPECQAGHLDLGAEAFKRIGDPVAGIIPITYQAVQNPRLPGPLTLRVKDGASQYWLALLADNTGNPLTKLEIRVGSGWQALTRADYNYWLDDNGAGNGPFTVRLTDALGQQSTVSGINLTPGTTQRTSVSMYGGAAQAPPAAPAAPVTTAAAAPAPPLAPPSTGVAEAPSTQASAAPDVAVSIRAGTQAAPSPTRCH
jgi:expansin (peptidoglycan-binding protein)